MITIVFVSIEDDHDAYMICNPAAAENIVVCKMTCSWLFCIPWYMHVCCQRDTELRKQ